MKSQSSNISHEELIQTQDCCKFSSDVNVAALHHFVTNVNCEIPFANLKFEKKNHNPKRIIKYDYDKRSWLANCFVGEAKFRYNGERYVLKVNPRFGKLSLFRMLEEIYKINILDSYGKLSQELSIENLIREFKVFYWKRLLRTANRHGLPRKYKREEFCGNVLRGKLDIRKTVLSKHNRLKIVCYQRVKILNPLILQILSQAYNKLESYSGLRNFIRPQDELEYDVISKFYKRSQFRKVQNHEFSSISYSEIDKSYKPLVDLSWYIICGNDVSSTSDEQKKSPGLFVDMSEVWEEYLRTILRKKLFEHGWLLINNTFEVYRGMKYFSKIIPDLIFEKDGKLIVFDAKWKQMGLDKDDFDREDFFQIHTYIDYLNKYKKVLGGGLLYPISGEIDERNVVEQISESLYGLNRDSIKFLIDGIVMNDLLYESRNERPNESEIAIFNEAVERFMKRISDFVNSLEE